MKAARYYGQRDLRVEDIPEPQIKAGHVKVAVAFTGICGTDLHEWAGGPSFAPQAGNPHPITHEVMPVTLGHEFSGIIHEVGDGVDGLVVGQKVAVMPMFQCAACFACKRGAPMACDQLGFVGLSGWGGGLSEYVVIPKAMCFPLPPEMPLEYGALVEPLAVGAHAVSSAGVQPGDNVLVIGSGPIGVSIILSLKAAGAGQIIVSEMATARKRFAAHYGAHHVLDPTQDDIVGRVKELCGGDLADVVYDCAGVPKSIETACKAVRSRGTVCNVAIWEKPIPFFPNWLTFKESRYMAILAYDDDDFHTVIASLATGSIVPDDMITKRITLDDVVEEGFKTLLYDNSNQVKILVAVGAAGASSDGG